MIGRSVYSLCVTVAKKKWNQLSTLNEIKLYGFSLFVKERRYNFGVINL